MKSYVVDENVIIVAYDNRTQQADNQCKLKCIQELEAIKERATIVLDSAGEVIQRYRTHISKDGHPTTARYFIEYLMNNYNPKYVVRQDLGKDPSGKYVNFPNDKDLKKFDPDDKIYVALVVAHKNKTKLVNAVDSDYRDHSTALKRHEVVVKELCPQCLS